MEDARTVSREPIARGTSVIVDNNPGPHDGAKKIRDLEEIGGRLLWLLRKCLLPFGAVGRYGGGGDVLTWSSEMLPVPLSRT